MRIHAVRSHLATSYLIEHGSLFGVDAGFVGHGRKVLRTIGRLGHRPADLSLVVVTHPHADHYGGLPRLLAETPFDVACHTLGVSALASSLSDVSPGLTAWAKAYEALARVTLPRLGLGGTHATVPLDDGTELHERGLPGRVIHTPGHTDACISLLLDDGTAFVGDLITGPSALAPLPTPTTMAVDLERTFEGWRRLLALGATRFMPAHGRPFTAAELERGMDALGV